MEKVQYLTRSAIRRASTIEMPQQARQNLQELFINFCLILICLSCLYASLLCFSEVLILLPNPLFIIVDIKPVTQQEETETVQATIFWV